MDRRQFFRSLGAIGGAVALPYTPERVYSFGSEVGIFFASDMPTTGNYSNVLGDWKPNPNVIRDAVRRLKGIRWTHPTGGLLIVPVGYPTWEIDDGE